MMYRAYFIVFIAINQSINQCTIIYHKSISLYNMYSYMFRRLCVIIREFLHLYLAKLHKFLKLKLLNLR
jgi:hypothetical protein